MTWWRFWQWFDNHQIIKKWWDGEIEEGP